MCRSSNAVTVARVKDQRSCTLSESYFFLFRPYNITASWRPTHLGSIDGKRNEIRGAPGGRTRYPMTMRKISVETATATRAGIKSGNILDTMPLLR